MSRRLAAGLLALLVSVLALLWALHGPSPADCQAEASVAEEDCRRGPLALHVEEELHDECRALYDLTYAQCVQGSP